QRLAGPGRRGDEGIASLRDRRPSELLSRRRPLESPFEPRADQGMEHGPPKVARPAAVRSVGPRSKGGLNKNVTIAGPRPLTGGPPNRFIARDARGDEAD